MNSRKTRAKGILLGPIISIVALLLFFGSFEGVLRLVDYGSSPLFYRSSELKDGTPIYRENKDFAFPYFEKSIIRTPQPFILNKEKKENEYRVFLLGSSAAMGDPEASFSIARVLEVMLEKGYPEINFEVVNAAMTAINSHVVKRIARDCSELDPDLFIAYEGNNEVIGPFGPSGALSPFITKKWLIDVIVGLKESRTGQLLSAVFSRKRDDDLSKRWGGMEMFLEQKVTQDDPRLLNVEKNFSHNLHEIVKYGENADVKTLLCTVLVNKRDFAPFQSVHKKGLDTKELENWSAEKQKGNDFFSKGKLDDALKHYLLADSIDDQNADLNFRIGRLYLELENREKAKVHLNLALQQDALRFRTDAVLNEVIRSVSKAIPDTTELVDLEQIFEEMSSFNLLGDEWLYEHVHLNFHANFQIAQILFESVSEDLFEKNRIGATVETNMEYSEAMRALAYNACEQAVIASELLNRFQKPPFTSQSDSSIRLAMWQERVEYIQEALDIQEVKEAAMESYVKAIEIRDDWILKRNYGMALLAFGKQDEAVKQLEPVHQLLENDVDTIYSLAIAFQNLDRESESKELFDELERLVPNHPGLQTRVK